MSATPRRAPRWQRAAKNAVREQQLADRVRIPVLLRSALLAVRQLGQQVLGGLHPGLPDGPGNDLGEVGAVPVLGGDVPALFEQALRQLLSTPMAGLAYPTTKRPAMRRLLLPRTGYHVYFALERDESVVVIHSVWGARRGRGPRL